MATLDRLRAGITVPGLRLRPYAGEADLPEIVRITNAEALADGLYHRTTVEEMASSFAHPSEAFQPERDVTIAELDGRIVGQASREVVNTTDGFREYRNDGEVDPAFRRRGIGAALLAENLRRHRERAAEDPTDRERLFGSWTWERQVGDIALMESFKFAPARWFFDMVRPNLDEIPERPLPAGFELRPIDRSLARQVWEADIEAFQDHWGGFDGSEEHLQRWLDNPHVDLSMWVVAFDGDEVAGGIINAIDPEQNRAAGVRRGWLQSVFTRRAWRRRGLATALIAESLRVLRDRGMTSAALGVDAANPSGAFGLYEGLGFGVTERATAWRRPFE
ncbi:MAG TPA: GNAT family N-acetyltransferase [Candidatus Limnocylindrales bacterium]|nr:GNAT family N-acetyltransferase [Candidatus Limnocylindrales bacterium]